MKEGTYTLREYRWGFSECYIGGIATNIGKLRRVWRKMPVSEAKGSPRAQGSALRTRKGLRPLTPCNKYYKVIG